LISDPIPIKPSQPELPPPFNPKLQIIFPTKHPIPLLSHSPLQLLIHIALHTLKLNPQPFTLHLHEPQQVKQPHLLINFHLHYIPNHPNSHITPIILTQPNIT
ncbi:PTS glucose transporter subunit IIA, partial [Staphylococcus aureus]|uniref:PTS glucose transporter subunit IIA n=1 Tax=Staphylococcus aureus TaxID=1280 RepID=UPI0016424EE6